MLKNIIKQVWNQRRQNGWILLELIIAGFFLWTVIDPVYILTVNHLTPRGYDMEGRYVLHLGMYGSDHGKRDTTVTKEQMKTAFLHVLRLVRDCPEVESVCLVQNYSFPNGGSWSGSQYLRDTLQTDGGKFVHTQEYTFNDEGGNPFKTYGMKNALTGGDLEMPEDAAARNLLFVSESFARQMFGTLDVVGRKIYTHDKKEREIGGVFDEYRHRDFDPAYPLVVGIKNGIKGSSWMHYIYMVVFKLKDGIDEESFIERFEKEVAPQITLGNLYYKELKSFDEQRREYAKQNSTYNVIRLKLALAVFTLLCIFLGMVGTFWIRCNARRQEVGLMRSLGATRQDIIRRFLTESALLVTVAFIGSLLILMHYVMEDNMAKFECTGMTEFMTVNWFMEEGPHFFMVSVVTYLALLAIALIGTLIPVWRASKVLPADALRDE